MTANAQGLETLMSSLGGIGKFQLTIHLLAASTYIVLTFNHVIMAFHGSPIPHSCMAGAQSDPDTDNSSRSAEHNNLVNISHGQCSSTLLFGDGQNETLECMEGQWTYHPKYQEKNIVNQFDLVCSDKHLASLATTIYFVGVMVGGLVFGDLADRLGRLPVMLLTLYASAVVGVVTAFSVNYIMFVVMRFISGILMQGLQTSVYTLIMELFVAKDRPFAGAITECFFGGSVILLAGLAYLIRDWRYLQIAISVPSLLAVAFPWIIPESLRWLIMKGKKERAEALLKRICKMNEVPYPSESWQQLMAKSSTETAMIQQQKQYNLTDIFRTAHLRNRSFILFYLWLAISTVYYGLTFKMTSFKGSRYLIFFIGGVVETMAYIASMPIMKKFGRKKPLLLCFIIGAVMCICAGCISQFYPDMSVLIVSLALAGRCAVACLFGIIFVYTSEIYPTVVRNIGMGACCFWTRAGGVLAPQINQWTKTLWGVDAIIVFGVLSLLAALFIFPLPETHNWKLPDAVIEVEVDSPQSDLETGAAVSLEVTGHQEEEEKYKNDKVSLVNGGKLEENNV